jgi:hypothetical protein
MGGYEPECNTCLISAGYQGYINLCDVYKRYIEKENKRNEKNSGGQA